jgi:hypothetical protein
MAASPATRLLISRSAHSDRLLAQHARTCQIAVKAGHAQGGPLLRGRELTHGNAFRSAGNARIRCTPRDQRSGVSRESAALRRCTLQRTLLAASAAELADTGRPWHKYIGLSAAHLLSSRQRTCYQSSMPCFFAPNEHGRASERISIFRAAVPPRQGAICARSPIDIGYVPDENRQTSEEPD